MTRAVRTRRVVGLPGGTTALTAVGVRAPPPVAGTQPTCGLKVSVFLALPTYVATKTTVREVVIPGATGLPVLPMKETSIARLVSSASMPPTT